MFTINKVSKCFLCYTTPLKRKKMFSTVFKKPKILALDKDLTIAPVSSYSYAKSIYYIPLLSSEISKASCSYPILFAKVEEEIFPIALLSLTENKNSFVDRRGKWEEGFYIPAFLKTYPFAITPVKWNEPSRVIYDASYKGIKKENGIEIIKDRKITEKGEKILENIKKHYLKFQETVKDFQKLDEMGLFKEADVILATEEKGQSRVLTNIYQIDVDKLDKLTDSEILFLVKTGIMAAIYFHLASFGNIEKLKSRLK